MITIIETNDGRILVTDKEDIDSVIEKAQDDGVPIDDYYELTDDRIDTKVMRTTDRSYALITLSHEVEFPI